jgi:hypothetical protein
MQLRISQFNMNNTLYRSNSGAGSRWALIGHGGFKSIHDSRLEYLGFTIGCFGILSRAYRVSMTRVLIHCPGAVRSEGRSQLN